MKIGILQTGHAPEALIDETGDYDEMFNALLDGNDFTFETFAVVDGKFPQSVNDADGWVITGSRHGAYEKHPWIPPLEDLIHDIIKSGKPMVGVCFGHQVIAQALGGKVEKFKGGWSVGRTDYDLNGKTVTLNAWHQDQITQLPEGAKVLGSNHFCQYAMVAYGDNVWTVQAHPEYSNEFLHGLRKTRGKGVVPEEILKEAADRQDGPNNNSDIGRFMAEFLKKARA